MIDNVCVNINHVLENMLNFKHIYFHFENKFLLL